jgi:hypothetical protein
MPTHSVQPFQFATLEFDTDILTDDVGIPNKLQAVEIPTLDQVFSQRT